MHIRRVTAVRVFSAAVRVFSSPSTLHPPLLKFRSRILCFVEPNLCFFVSKIPILCYANWLSYSHLKIVSDRQVGPPIAQILCVYFVFCRAEFVLFCVEDPDFVLCKLAELQPFENRVQPSQPFGSTLPFNRLTRESWGWGRQKSK